MIIVRHTNSVVVVTVSTFKWLNLWLLHCLTIVVVVLRTPFVVHQRCSCSSVVCGLEKSFEITSLYTVLS